MADATINANVVAGGKVTSTVTSQAVATGNVTSGGIPAWPPTGTPAPLMAGGNTAGGYPVLDGGGKIASAQLPISIMDYKGVWNASTNSPTLVDGTGSTGDVYRVGTGASRNLGSGSITFDVGDYAIYNGSTWEKSDTTDAVASVAGLTGAVSSSGLKTALGVSTSAVINVKDAPYSAVGDGTANDAAAINAAIAAAPSGGALYFPEGTYKFNSVITVSKPLRLYSNGNAVLKLGALTYINVTGTTDVTIEGLKFDGNRTVLGTGSDAMIYAYTVSRVRIRNCNFINLPTLGIDLYRAAYVWITNNTFDDVYLSAVRLEDPGASNHNEHIWIKDNYFNNSPSHSSGGLAIGGHSAIQAGGVTTAEAHRYIHVEGNVVNMPQGVGIGLDALYKSTVIGNTVYKDATCAGGECIAFTGPENVIADNYCHNNATSSGAAILLFAALGISCAHNQIINNRLTNAGQGVAFVWGTNGAAIDDLLIRGNHCYGNNRGVQSYIAAGVTSGSQSNVLIADNDLTGNTTEPILLTINAGGITGVPTVRTNVGAWRQARTQVAVSPSSATPAINTDNIDMVLWYGQTANITSMTTNLSGTPKSGDRLTVLIQDAGTPLTMAWGASFTGHLLTATVAFKMHTQELIYSEGHGKWLGTFVDTAGV